MFFCLFKKKNYVIKFFLLKMRIDLLQWLTIVNEDGGAEMGIILSRPGCLCAEGGERHTGNNLWRLS